MTVLDANLPVHAAALHRLESEQVAWLTTVSPSGMPQASPVWFLWEESGTALVFSQPDTVKTRNLSRNGRAGLHLNGDEHGGHVLVMEGEVSIGDEPGAEVVTRYLAKYRAGLTGLGMNDVEFRASYSVPLHFVPTRARAW